jgi:membrane fusion protein (multidrug efflux system)/multidrug efflux system membrane fusion protein
MAKGAGMKIKKSRLIWLALLFVATGFIAFRVISNIRNSAPKAAAPVLPTVRAVQVSVRPLKTEAFITGAIRSRYDVDVLARVPGRVERLFVDVGQNVKAGQSMAQIEHVEIALQREQAQAQLEAAKVSEEAAKLDYERTQKLFEGEAVSKAVLDGAHVRLKAAVAQTAVAKAALDVAKKRVNDSKVLSPIDGVVTKKLSDIGKEVSPGMPLFSVQDTSALRLESSVDAETYFALKKGAVVDITVDALKGEVFEGTLSTLSPALDPVSRRSAIEITIKNNGRLLPNMFAKAHLQSRVISDAHVLPQRAVIGEGPSAAVFVIEGKKLKRVLVVAGVKEAGFVQVEGLATGTRVVAEAGANLSDGMEVNVEEGH